MIWKIELNHREVGPCKVERYRAVVDASSMDAAIAAARGRFGLAGALWPAMAQAMDDRELANLDRAAAWFMDRGFLVPSASGPEA